MRDLDFVFMYGWRRLCVYALLLAVQTLAAGESQLSYSTDTTKHFKPFCENDVFSAVCDEGYVILMTHARYGRMTLSRCAKVDYGHIGCSADVLELADCRCSGRRVCEITIPDALFAQTKPCPEDLKPHLEAEYICVPVLTPAQKCLDDGRAVPVTVPSAYLASIVTEETGCGGLSNPWTIDAGQGQRIRVTLLDFNVARAKVVGHGSRGTRCSSYAIVQEQLVNGPRRVTLCGGGVARERQVYQSTTNRLEIGFTNNEDSNIETPYFMLKYEATGCVDIATTTDVWAIRQGDHLIIRCNQTMEEFHLSCVGQSWIGDFSNCTLPVSTHWTSSVNKTSHDEETSLSYGRCFVIILVTASAVGLIMLCFGLLVLSRKRVFWTKQDIRESNHKHSITLKVTGFDEEDCLASGHVSSVLHSLHSVGAGCSPSLRFSDCSERSRTDQNCVEECYDCARRRHDTAGISTCGCRLGLISEGPFPAEIDPCLECSRGPDHKAMFSAADANVADKRDRSPYGRLTSPSALLGEMQPHKTARATHKSRGRTKLPSVLLGEARLPKMAVSLRQTDDVKMQRSQNLSRTSSLPFHNHHDDDHHLGLSPSSEVQGRRRLSKLDCILEGKPLICCESAAERTTDDEDQSTFPLSVTG